jgi:peptide/nickel transport system permease protein
MARLIGERIAQAVFVLLGASVIVFLLIHETGGDIAGGLVRDTATAAQVATLRHKLGLDQPIYIQYLQWAWRMLHADFGNSFTTGFPALPMVLARFPATVELAVAAEAIALVLAVPLGVLAAVHRASWWDRACMSLALLGQSIPNFWLALMLILVFAVTLQWLPVSGRDTPLSIVLPAITLSVAPLAQFARLVRSGMLEILGQDYVRTARAKGLAESVVINKHALRNALLPFVTIVGLELGSLLNGAVIIETVSAWPGIGYLLVRALEARDIPVIEVGVLLVATIYVVLNLAVDLLYIKIDPRIRVR